MARQERVTKLKQICETHGRPNNQYYHDGLAVKESHGHKAWWFRFVDGDIVTEIGVTKHGDIYQRQQWRQEGKLELDFTYDYGPFPQYNDRVDQKINELLTKASQ